MKFLHFIFEEVLEAEKLGLDEGILDLMPNMCAYGRGLFYKRLLCASMVINAAHTQQVGTLSNGTIRQKNVVCHIHSRWALQHSALP